VSKAALAPTAELRRRLQQAPPLGRRFSERLIESSLFGCALLSILTTIAIAIIILYEAVEFFRDPTVSVWDFFTGTEWSAGFQNPRYGIWPLVVGTLQVATIAGCIALPVGLLTAIFLSEYATPRLRGIAKPTLELLAGIPTVVYGYFALTALTPDFLAHLIPGIESFNQLSGGIVVGIMILPMVASLSEDAIRSVPRTLREASYALGANKFTTSLRVVVPAALSGIIASFVLALSRAIGETMAVSLACGNRPAFSLDPREGIATMTSFIVQMATGDVPHYETRFKSLFAVAAVLFFITLAMNIAAERVLRRYRQVYH
jgi:phosphate transport system permease protein